MRRKEQRLRRVRRVDDVEDDALLADERDQAGAQVVFVGDRLLRAHGSKRRHRSEHDDRGGRQSSANRARQPPPAACAEPRSGHTLQTLEDRGRQLGAILEAIGPVTTVAGLIVWAA